MDAPLDLRGSSEEWMLAGWALLLFVVLTIAARIMTPRTHRIRYGASVIFLIVAALGFVLGEMVSSPGAKSFFAGLAMISYGLCLARLLFLLGFDGIIARNRREPIPRILRDITQGVVFFVAAIFALRAAGVEPGQLLTTSALLTVVAGMALQETLGNLAAGLAMQGERPFEVGDWIEVHGTPSHIGRVREINWRATRLHTLDNVELVVPNGLLAKAMVTNHDRPHGAARRSVYFHVAYSVPPRKVHEIVLPGVREASGVLASPAPSLVTFGFDEAGVSYWLRYHINDLSRRDAIDGGVRDRVWYSLERSGISIAVPGRTISVSEVTPATEQARVTQRLEERVKTIEEIDLFSPLSPDERRQLAEDARAEIFAAGETIIRRGERGDTMYLVKSGEVTVRVDNGSGGEVDAVTLGVGTFFGEMSLLTGDPRRATVVAASSCELLVIGHVAFKKLFVAHPEVAKQISEKVVERDRGDAFSKLSAGTKQETEIAERALIGRIKDFFGI